MLNFYILCKHLVEAVKKQQALDEHIKRIIDAVETHKLDIQKEENIHPQN